MRIILASTSRYRQALLARLNMPFQGEAPQIVEERLPDESPAQMARRLSTEKARAVATRYSDSKSLIIGADQVAAIGNHILRKPGTTEKNLDVLRQLQGNWHTLYTAFTIINCFTLQHISHMVEARLLMRAGLTDAALLAYIEQDHPQDCAGGYKLECAGISLFEQIMCEDWTAIQGLPLMALAHALRRQTAENA